MPIDFTVYQMQHIADQEHTLIPGVLVERAAKMTHRHRQSDLFALQINLDGAHTFSAGDLEDMLKKASGAFFHTQGSVTRAIQTTIDEINKDLYAYNSEWGYDGKQALGSVNLCVLHHDWLFIGQVGDAHVYRIGENVYDLYGESGDAVEKLGVSRRMHPRLYQCPIAAGDLLLMSPRAHGSWKSYYLSNSHRIPMDQVKRRLHNQMIQDFSVVAIKSEAGTGLVHQGNWNAEVDSAGGQEDQQEPPRKVYEKPESRTVQGAEKIEVMRPSAIVEDEIKEGGHTLPEDLEKEIPQQTLSISEGETENAVIPPDEYREKVEKPNSGNGGFIKTIARLWMAGKTTRAKIQLSLTRLRRKVLPKSTHVSEKTFSWQKAAVLIIPIVLIVGSAMVYSNFGKDEQYNFYIASAREKVNAAELIENDAERNAMWAEILNLSIKAEEYRVTHESRQLFQQAQSIVDGMDLTKRLEFRPAMTQPFPESVQVTMIKDSASGVYLLDSNSGSVLRVFVNSKGFLELDQEFKCAPGGYGLVNMEKIVDFVALPANSKGYKVLAIDETGNLLYCHPGKQPDSRTLTIPEGGWGKISKALFFEERLLIIDPMKNNIWIYQSNTDSNDDLSGIVFVETPISFFDEKVPDIGGAIGAVINQEDLYILHEDGHITMCQYGYKDVRLTECQDPIPFTDDRAGSDNKKPWIFMGTHFIAMDHAVLPNRSIYILDQDSGALFRFSMQLNLENTLKPQLNPNFPLPDSPPTGFGVLTDQEVLMAYGNQLFTAPLQ